MEHRIHELRAWDPAEVPPLLTSAVHLPYAGWREATPRFRAEVLGRRAQSWLRGGGRIWSMGAGVRSRGLVALVDLPHESRHFRRSCARLAFLDAWEPASRESDLAALLGTAIDAAEAVGHSVLWLQARAIDMPLQHLLVERGFRFADALVDWSAEVRALTPTPAVAGCTLHLGAVPDEREDLGELAARAMVFNRFRAEGRFDPAGVDALYRELGVRCAEGALGDALWVARGPDGKPWGFACLEWAERRAGGAPEEAGFFRFLVRAEGGPPGVGPALLDAGCRWFAERGAERLLAQTVVQNTGMFRSALAKGFRVEDALYDWFLLLGGSAG